MALPNQYMVRRFVLLLALILLAFCLNIRQQTSMAPSLRNTKPEARLSFTFDDGLTTSLTKAAPVLARYGFVATDFVITNCVGTQGTCPANTDTSYMSWSQVQQLHSRYSWEIGSHTVTHPQLTEFSGAKQERELAESKNTLAAHGYDAGVFASPYGDYDNHTLALAAKYYQAHRGFWDIGYNQWPYNEYLLKVQQIQSNISVEQAMSFIDHAIQNRQWVIFVFHDIKDNPSQNPDDFEYGTTALDQIARYAKQRNITVAPIGPSLAASSINLLVNSSFSDKLTAGWSTDSPANVRQDCQDHGSYPDPRCSARLTSSAKTVHLYSSPITVQPGTAYMIKSFLNMASINQGELGYHIDEYDARGQFVASQTKTAEHNVFVEDINFVYKPSTPNVSKARLRLDISPNANITAYVDNFQWYPLGAQ